MTRLSVTVQDLTSVIGKLTPTRLAVLLAPVYTQSLQQQLIETLRSTGSSKAQMTLNQASQDISSGAAPTLEWESNHDTTTRHDHSDASLQGWGAVYNGTQTGDCGRFWRVNAT